MNANPLINRAEHLIKVAEVLRSTTLTNHPEITDIDVKAQADIETIRAQFLMKVAEDLEVNSDQVYDGITRGVIRDVLGEDPST
jgi:hypothetical protein